jgi:O-antigen ligase
MEQVDTANRIVARTKPVFAFRLADICGKVIFVSLLGLIVLTAIPYGTVEPWWKAAFVCVVFTLAILGTIEGLLSGSWSTRGWELLVPLFATAAFSFLQTVPFGTHAVPSIQHTSGNAISADPYETRFFTLQLLALTLAAALFYRYASTDRRVRILINVIIAVAVASAIFGLIRQTNQYTVGFGLPLVKPNLGYGQFINQNHFALLMEMGFGLALGMIAGRGMSREWSLIYLASLLTVWTALVLSNSRGGLLALLVQIIAAGLLFKFVARLSKSKMAKSRVLRALRLLSVRILLVLVLVGGVVMGTLWIGSDRLAIRLAATRGESEARLGGSRNEIWRATWQMFKSHPIVGVGMGGYAAAIPAYHDASGTLTPQEAHNEYLELLASGGIIGALLGGWFVFLVFRRTRANLQSRSRFRLSACYGAALGLVGVAVHSLFDFGLHMMANALIFMALVVIATRSRRSRRKLGRRNA